VTILHGDCVQVMAGIAPNSVDAIVTDPPYGLEFMGKEWDRLGDIGKTSHSGPAAPDPGPWGRRERIHFHGSSNAKCRTCGKWQWDYPERKCACETPDLPNVKAHQARIMQDWHELWATEAYRVLKPGGRLLAFGGTRTNHRMACAIEDAGFVIEDTIAWLYGSGFPKHKSKLKPAHEPVVVAWKPDAKATPLNVDACRIGFGNESVDLDAKQRRNNIGGGGYEPGVSGKTISTNIETYKPLGRWPANVALGHHESCQEIGTKRVKGGSGWSKSGSKASPNLAMSGPNYDREPKPDAFAAADGTETVAAWDCHPDCAVALLDAQSGERPSGAWNGKRNTPKTNGIYGSFESYQERGKSADTGGASRFFYQAKASRRERNAGLDGLPERAIRSYEGGPIVSGDHPDTSPGGHTRPAANGHPTVKPIALMAWLIRLVAKPGDTVLDPFAGSGTTGCAAALEGVSFIGIEQNAEYIGIAERRIAHWTEHGADALRYAAPAPKASETDGTYAGGKGYGGLSYCPDHLSPRDTSNGHYRCGCAIRIGTNADRQAVNEKRQTTFTDLPLFAAVAD
jgi:DNA modification methylase